MLETEHRFVLHDVTVVGHTLKGNQRMTAVPAYGTLTTFTLLELEPLTFLSLQSQCLQA